MVERGRRSTREISPYRSERSPDWLKMKNPERSAYCAIRYSLIFKVTPLAGFTVISSDLMPSGKENGLPRSCSARRWHFSLPITACRPAPGFG